MSNKKLFINQIYTSANEYHTISYHRLMATLGNVYPDIGSDVVGNLLGEFRFFYFKHIQTAIDSQVWYGSELLI